VELSARLQFDLSDLGYESQQAKRWTAF
jgi:hypothetical protein